MRQLRTVTRGGKQLIVGDMVAVDGGLPCPSPLAGRSTGSCAARDQATAFEDGSKGSQQFVDFGSRLRRTEEIALRLRASFLPQAGELLPGLDTFGGRRHSEARAHCRDGTDDGQAIIAAGHVADEGTIDLDLVERKL